ncbi:MAG: hypothetical protein KatS3mg053_2632 [Candidatus Roseilinea sp.]|jgi:hypothetical protein|nr:MAG: hypothetical protein KatS3mg053_2632 [Candidatus Roseilinea sp.]
MAQSALFRLALGEAFDRLAPVLQRHYDLAPGQEVIVQGTMKAWNRFAWARVLAPFMPIPAEQVPVYVRNCGVVDRGEVCYAWHREFRYPSGVVVSYTLTRPARDGLPARVLDTFNQPPNLGITLALEVSPDGQALRQMTAGPQFLIRGERYAALPGAFHIYSIAIERAVDEHTVHTEVVVSHPVFGRIFGYNGVLRVS